MASEINFLLAAAYDDFDGFCAQLRLHAGDGPMQMRAFRVFEHMCDMAADSADSMADAVAVVPDVHTAAVEALETHKASSPVVYDALHVIFSLYQRKEFWDAAHDTLKQQAPRARAATLAAMRAHAGCADVQLMGLFTLMFLINRADAAQKAAAVECGAIEIVVAALRAFTSTSDMQTVGLQLLMSLAGERSVDAANVAKAVSAGGFEAVLAALRAHVEDDRITGYCCQILSVWVDTSAAYAAQAASAGAIEAVVAVLKTHTTRVLVAQSLAMLSTICHDAAAKRTAGCAGLLEVIAATMRAQDSDTLVQGTAAEVISQLAQDRDVLASAGAAEAIDALVEAARAYPNVGALLERVFTAIRWMCAREDNRRRAWSAGAVDAALATINQMGAPREVLVAALGMLTCIVPGSTYASAVAGVRGFEQAFQIIIGAMHARPCCRRWRASSGLRHVARTAGWRS